jgi:3-oxoacyl-[acyl-carrier protein] reductase
VISSQRFAPSLDGARGATSRKVGLEEAKQQFLQQSSIGRFDDAEEIADVMAFVVSSAARWITGTVRGMDGGEVNSA